MESIKEFPRGISDQVISLRAATAGTGVHPGPGQQPQASSAKLLEPQATSVKPQAQRLKLQAASSKHQASSAKLVKQQAASFKPFATSIKLQATSFKLQDPGPFVKFHGTRTEGLYHDKTITWMLHMEGNLVW